MEGFRGGPGSALRWFDWLFGSVSCGGMSKWYVETYSQVKQLSRIHSIYQWHAKRTHRH